MSAIGPRTMGECQTPAPATGGFAAKAIAAKAKSQEQEQTAPVDEQDADASEDVKTETEQEQHPEDHLGLPEYQAGQNAAAEGFARSDCPHKDDTEKAKNWAAGFDNVAESE